MRLPRGLRGRPGKLKGMQTCSWVRSENAGGARGPPHPQVDPMPVFGLPWAGGERLEADEIRAQKRGPTAHVSQEIM